MATAYEVHQAIEAGRLAKAAGKTEQDNPYYQNTVQWHAWMVGLMWPEKPE